MQRLLKSSLMLLHSACACANENSVRMQLQLQKF